MSEQSLPRFEFGNPKVNAAGFQCCGKPVGCNITEGCAYLRHPWKRAMVYGDSVCRECGGDVQQSGDLCVECLKHWECPECQTRVPRPYPTCHQCAAPKPEGAVYA